MVLAEEFTSHHNKYAGTDNGNHHVAQHAVAAQANETQQQAANKAADDAQDDVVEEAALRIHDLTGDVTGEGAQQDAHDDTTHRNLPSFPLNWGKTPWFLVLLLFQFLEVK